MSRLTRQEMIQFKWLLGTLFSWVSLWTLYVLEIASHPLLWAFTLVLAVIFFKPALPGRIPAWCWRLATPLLIAFVLIDFLLQGRDFLPAMIRLVLLLTIYRALQYRTRREDVQLILLGLFNATAAGVLSISMVFAVQMLVLVPMAMGLMLLVTLLEHDGPAAPEPGDWVHFRWPVLLRRLAQCADRRLLALSGVLFVALVAVGSTVFILMPRFTLENRIPLLEMRGQARTGFSDEISFGQITDLAEDNTVAFRVDPPDLDRVPRDPYWRMVVLDRYAEGRFRASTTLRLPAAQREVLEYRPRQLDLPEDAGAREGDWHFYYEGNISHFLPTPGPFGLLRFQKTEVLTPSDDAVVYRIRQAPATLLAYQLRDVYLTTRLPETESNIGRIETMLADPASVAGQQHLYPFSTLALSLEPDDRAALRGMVQDITSGETLLAGEFIEKAIAWLHQGRGYSLSVRLRPGVDGDPVIRWLRSGSDGWCEYFAAALLLLAREAGHPARVVTGFRGASVNQYEGFITVRNRDAHAWVEIYDGDGFWVRADPTPGGGQEGLVGEALADMLGESGWTAWIDSLRVQWYRRVVNFDQTDQQQIAERVVEGTRAMVDDAKAWVNEQVEQFKAWITRPWDLWRVGQWAMVLGLVVVLLTQVRRLRDWLLAWLALGGTRLGRAGATEPLRRKAGYWLRRLQQAGDEEPRHREDATWQQLRAHLRALRYGPAIDPIQAPAIFRDARRWWHSRRKRLTP